MSYTAMKRVAAAAGVSIAAVLVAIPSGALAASGCSAPTLSAPFVAFGDTNLYALVPGQAADMFSGTGWTMTGGATIVTTTLYDGSKGNVLDLPSGATAVSPPMCVDNTYPTARAMERTVAGGNAGVTVSVTYSVTGTTNIGDFKGGPGAWSPSKTVNIQSTDLTTPQLAQFTFVGKSNKSDYQLYDFYVDPRMH